MERRVRETVEGGYEFLGPDLETVAEILSDRFYFVTFSKYNFTKTDKESHYFNTDLQLSYANYFDDFGPLNLAQLYRYWVIVREKLNCHSLKYKRLIHWTTTDYKKRANAAFLVGSFAVLHLNIDPIFVYRLLLSGKHPFVPFQDVACGVSRYRIKLKDCFNTLKKAHDVRLLQLHNFDLAHYEHYEKVENGDMSWIIADKMLALSGPRSFHADLGCTPESYISYFKANCIFHIVRLNRPSYHESCFTNSGIAVHDMYFRDGSIPPKEIVYRFLALAENTHGPIAVHCKAGLGRTGCLIGAYLMKHYAMTATEAIAWMRICRPGCVIGHQQTWLERMQHYLHRSGKLYRLRVFGDPDKIIHHPRGVYQSMPRIILMQRPKLLLSPSVILGSQTSIIRRAVNSIKSKDKKKKNLIQKSSINYQNSENLKNENQGDFLNMKKWQKTLLDLHTFPPPMLKQRSQQLSAAPIKLY